MLTVAYLANEFPCALEPYVGEEIDALRRRGVEVIPGSVSRVKRAQADVVLAGAGLSVWLRALVLCVSRSGRISDLVIRILFRGSESPWKRAKALGHTFLGACYAAVLEDKSVEHIHVHHGYFGSWVGMTAARLLGIGFSVTLHGSDLLLHGSYLDTKLENCDFCFTISEYNRNHILKSYPEIDHDKVVVARLGVDVPDLEHRRDERRTGQTPFTIVAVGRLHPVKDHAFLIRGCAELQDRGMDFECLIAGDGPERQRLEDLIREKNLDTRIKLLGHVPRSQVGSVYDRADLAVLTSRSEGIPLVLMEAMARRKVVLAPNITGIPELVIPGNTGFLYESGSMQDFVEQVQFVYSQVVEERACAIPRAVNPLDWIRFGAQIRVAHNFNRETNLESFCDRFLAQITRQAENIPDENLVLQQI